MHRHTLVRAVALLLASAAGALPAHGQSKPPSGPGGRAASTVEYRLGTGAMTGVPIVAGRTVRIHFLDQNPLCHAYGFDVKPHLATVDMAKLVATLSSVPSAPAAAAAGGAPPDANPPRSTTESAPGRASENLHEEVTAATVATHVETALEAVDAVRTAASDVVAALGLIEKPTCDGSVPVQAIRTEWDARAAPSTVRAIPSRISTATLALGNARAERKAVIEKDQSRTDMARLLELDVAMRNATAALDTLQRTHPDLARRTTRASAIVRSLAEAEKGTVTEVFVPQGTDTLHLGIGRRDLHTADGKPATPVLQTVPIPVRNGMRFFLSAGAMASKLRSRDYQRVTRAYSDAAKGVYSTYSNVSRGNAFAFSPVLQGNVAFHEVRNSGASFLGSAGVAVRSVNGSNSPEFLLGVGLSFLDRMVLTVGAHMGRQERLLIGKESEVQAGPVPETVTESSAIGVEWKPAFVTAFSFRLN